MTNGEDIILTNAFKNENKIRYFIYGKSFLKIKHKTKINKI